MQKLMRFLIFVLLNLYCVAGFFIPTSSYADDVLENTDTLAPLLVSAVGIGALFLNSQSHAKADASARDQLQWAPCQKNGDPQFQCTYVNVPLDYDNPNAQTIPIRVMRAPAFDSAHKLGVLFVNEGGPWSDDVDGIIDSLSNPNLPPFFIPIQKYLNLLRQRFDIMAFNPRGVSPALVSCNSAYDGKMINEDLGTIAGVISFMQFAKAKVAYCMSQNKYGQLLPYLSTANTARDLEMIRRALKVSQINYYGASYGTELGARYLLAYPEHVRAMVIDGNMPPYNDMQALREPAAHAIEGTLQRFFSECKKSAACPIASDPQGIYSGLLDKLRTESIPSYSSSGKQQELTAAMFLNDVYENGGGMLALNFAWPILAKGISDAYFHNDGTTLVEAFDEMNGYNPDDNTFTNDDSLVSAVLCLDFGNHPDAVTILNTTEQLWQKDHYPLLGGSGTVAFQSLCLNWPVTVEPLPIIHTKQQLPPILVVNNIDDPTTAYAFAESMANSLPNSRLLTVSGAGHIALTNEGDAMCEKNYTADYFINLHLPPENAQCDDFINPFNESYPFTTQNLSKSLSPVF